MPQLNPANLPIDPASKAVEVFRAKLESAKGNIGKLNNSVKLGADSILKDAIEGKQLESAAPYVRIEYGTGMYHMNGTGGILWELVPIALFFVYYVKGYMQPNPLPVHFTEERNAHIRWNMEHLKDKIVKPWNAIGMTVQEHRDDAGQQFWYWSGDQDAPVTHEVPLKMLGVDINVSPAQGFTCSRVDFNIVVMNHATFNGDSLGKFSEQ